MFAARRSHRSASSRPFILKRIEPRANHARPNSCVHIATPANRSSASESSSNAVSNAPSWRSAFARSKRARPLRNDRYSAGAMLDAMSATVPASSKRASAAAGFAFRRRRPSSAAARLTASEIPSDVRASAVSQLARGCFIRSRRIVAVQRRSRRYAATSRANWLEKSRRHGPDSSMESSKRISA